MRATKIGLGIAALMVLGATLPAMAASNNVQYFQLDPAKLTPGSIWHLGVDSNGNLISGIGTALDVSLPAPLNSADACATVAPAVMSCTGNLGHAGIYHVLDSFGVYNAALGATNVDVGQDFGSLGKTVWRCHFNTGGGVVGIFFFPPGSGYCYYSSFSYATFTQAPWTLIGAQSGAGVVGPVVHLAV